jgi:hypothetical protein
LGNQIVSVRAAANAGFGVAEVTNVGEGLDLKVANLLRVVGVSAEQAFAQSTLTLDSANPVKLLGSTGFEPIAGVPRSTW